jgi:hypothetical protein
MKKILYSMLFVLVILCMLVACGNAVNSNNECEHDWRTVTTKPTCTEVGYDMMTCQKCGERQRVNETEKADHGYSAVYSFNDTDHWFVCKGCGIEKSKASHTPDGEGVCTVCQVPTAVTEGIIYGISADGTYAEVTGYEGTATKVRISDEYNGLPVKNIRDQAFAGKTGITFVAIPDSVTGIGSLAFGGCQGLISVMIPESVTTIGELAFTQCRSLESVIIPDSVTRMDPSVFSFCKNLTSVVIGNGVKLVGYRTFYGCTSLASVVVGSNVTDIGEGAFYRCTALTSIAIPKSVIKISMDAFYDCDSLADVYYEGSEDDWANINVYSGNSNNKPLSRATKHYNYTPKEQ